MIDPSHLRYTGKALKAFKKTSDYSNIHECTLCESTTDRSRAGDFSTRLWSNTEDIPHTDELECSSRHIGACTLTSQLAPWVNNAMANFQPSRQALDLVKPFSEGLHKAVDAERVSSSGLHDLDIIEQTYQVTLEVAAAVLLAADDAARIENATDNPIDLTDEIHSSRAGGDEEFAPWGMLLTGLNCDPPIIGLFPFYLMMCQAFTFEPTPAQEHYVYAALTGVDWIKSNGKFSTKLSCFEKAARLAVPKLDDKMSGKDRSFWRIAHSYLGAINNCENSRHFRVPRRAAIPHRLDIDLVIAMRGLDTIGSAFMHRDGVAWLDDDGFGSLVGSAVPNDVMDLHTDIKTRETRNLLRLLYPGGLSENQAKRIVSTVLSGLLSELYRGHHRARFDNREDGRIAATSPPYSLCRAQHRRIFETLEMYIDQYENFWDLTWEIFQMAKRQVTEAGLKEPLVCALKRAGKLDLNLPESPVTSFYDSYYKLVETTEPLTDRRPLAVSEDISPTIRELYRLWNIEIRAPNKERGWGHRLDVQSDKLFGDAGRILSKSKSKHDQYKFAIAYGRLSMSLPYIAYHTIAAIIMTYGIIEKEDIKV